MTEIEQLRDDFASIADSSSARRLKLMNLAGGEGVADLLERNGAIEHEAKALRLQTERKIGELTP